MLAGGSSYSEICARLGCTDRYISLWKERFQQERLGGLDSRYRGAEHRRRTAQTEAAKAKTKAAPTTKHPNAKTSFRTITNGGYFLTVRSATDVEDEASNS